MHPRSIAAIKSALGDEHYLLDYGSNVVRIRLPDLGASTEIRRLKSGRWIMAEWSSEHEQWQSSDYRADSPAWREQWIYAYTRNIEALPGAGIRTYRSPADAVRVFVENLQPVMDW